jgi:hypothetical protein
VLRIFNIKFFTFDDSWKPNFALCLGTGIVLNLIIINLIKKTRKNPVFAKAFQKNKKFTKITLVQTILGSVTYGIGWGFGNVSPSSLLMNFQFCSPHLIFFFFGNFLLGHAIGFYFDRLMRHCFRKKPTKITQDKAIQNNYNKKTASEADKEEDLEQKTDFNGKVVLSESNQIFMSVKYVKDPDDVDLSDKVIRVVVSDE